MFNLSFFIYLLVLEFFKKSTSTSATYVDLKFNLKLCSYFISGRIKISDKVTTL